MIEQIKTGAMPPPTEDAGKQHALRAQIQSLIWHTSHKENPVLKYPKYYGWIKGGLNTETQNV